MGRKIRRILKLGIGIFLPVLVITILLGPWLLTGPLHGKLVDAIEKRVEGDLSIEKVSLGWISGVSLRGLTLSEPGGGDAVIEVRRVDASPELLPLITGGYVVKALEIDGVTVRARKRDGEWNLTGLIPAKPNESGAADPPRRKRQGTLPQTRERIEIPRIEVDAAVRDVTVILTEENDEGIATRTVKAIDRLDVRLRRGEPLRIQLDGFDGLRAQGKLEIFDGSELRAPQERAGRFEVTADDYDLASLLVQAMGDRAIGWTGRLDIDQTVTLEGRDLVIQGSLRGRGVASRAATETTISSLSQESAPAPEMSFEAIDADLDLRIPMIPRPWPRGSVKVTTAPGRVSRPDTGRVFTIDSTTFAATFDRGRKIRIDEAKLVGGGGEVRVSGTAKIAGGKEAMRERIDLDLDLEASLDLREAAAMLPKDRGEWDGRLSLGGKLAFSARQQTARITGRGSQVRVTLADGEVIDLGEPDFECDAGRSDGVIRVDRFAMRAGELRAEASGRYDPDARTPEAIALKASGSVGDLRPFLGSRIPEGLAGRFTVDGTVIPADDLSFDLALTGDDVRVRSADEPHRFTATLRGSRFADSGLLDLPEIPMTIDSATGVASLRFEPGIAVSLGGDFNVELEKVVAAFSDFIPDGISASGPGSIRFAASAPLAVDGEKPGPEDVSLTVDAEAAVLDLAGLGLQQAKLSLAVADGTAEVTRGTAQVEGGTADFTAQLRYDVKPPVLMATLHASDVSVAGDTQGLIARAIPIFAGVGAVVTAKAGADLEILAQGADVETLRRSLQGTGSIRCQGGSVSGNSAVTKILGEIGADDDFDFEPFTAAFSIRNGTVLQDPFSIRSRYVDLRLSGAATVDGRLDYSVDVKPRGEGAKDFRRYLRIVDPNGYLPFGLKGDLRAPALVLPEVGDVVEEMLPGILERGLDELLDRDKRKKERDEEKKNKKRDPNKKKKKKKNNNKKKQDGKGSGG